MDNIRQFADFLKKTQQAVPPDPINQIDLTLQGSELNDFLEKSCSALHTMLAWPEDTPAEDKAFIHALLHDVLNIGVATGAMLYVDTFKHLDAQAAVQTGIPEEVRMHTTHKVLQAFLEGLMNQALYNIESRKPKA